MLIDVIAVEALPNFQLHITFENGVEGIVEFNRLTRFTGVFSPLKDPEYFARVSVHPELGVICWPNEADSDSEVLYWHITGVKSWDWKPGEEPARAGRLINDPNGEIRKSANISRRTLELVEA